MSSDGQAVKTAPSHGAIPGSIPGRSTKIFRPHPVPTLPILTHAVYPARPYATVVANTRQERTHRLNTVYW